MSSAPVSNTAPKTVTAAMLIIGDEILSGRTKDANLGHFAEELNAMGIQMREARVVSDVEDEIVDALNALRARFTYVFTTGGIGPTHDDITADAVAKAFGVSIDYDPRAVAILEAHYPKGALNEARMRMTRIPDGADLIENPVSNAPGFHIENVFVMAGVPVIAQAMLESVRSKLVGGKPVQSRAVHAKLAEGQIAEGLGTIQNAYADVSIGSYPFYSKGNFGVSLVLRSTEEDQLAAAEGDVIALVRSLGADPIDRAQLMQSASEGEG